MTKVNAKPFLKWAGGKSQLLEQFWSLYPDMLLENKVQRYVEPFVGAGAVLFELVGKFDFREIIINDINKDLILTYEVVKNHVDSLIEILSGMETDYLHKDAEARQKVYYEVRSNFNQEKKSINYKEFESKWINHAANFIFLNKTCFNGLYRLNRKGEFNVPVGKYVNPTICQRENLLNVSQALQNVKLLSTDFANLTEYIDNTTFVYIDPPYRPLNITSAFTNYSKDDFNDDDQRRLAEWFRVLTEKGALVMLSNSNPKNTNPDDDFFDKLYEGFDIKEVSAVRAINSKANKRGAISELVIRNYPLK